MTTAPALPAACTAAHAAAARGAAQSFQIEREAEAFLGRRWAFLPFDATQPASAHIQAFAQAILPNLGEAEAAEALWACGERTPADFGGDGLRGYADAFRHTVLGMVARAILARYVIDLPERWR
jgi:hypothetical protein